MKQILVILSLIIVISFSSNVSFAEESEKISEFDWTMQQLETVEAAEEAAFETLLARQRAQIEALHKLNGE